MTSTQIQYLVLAGQADAELANGGNDLTEYVMSFCLSKKVDIDTFEVGPWQDDGSRRILVSGPDRWDRRAGISKPWTTVFKQTRHTVECPHCSESFSAGGTCERVYREWGRLEDGVAAKRAAS